MATSPISVQLYTVREALAHDVPGTLRRLADLGLTQVEPFDLTARAAALAPALAEAGLSAPTAHARVVGEDLDAVVAAATALGTGTVIDPRVATDRWHTAGSIASIADDLNAAAAVAARHGVRVGYHNHAQEVEVVLDGRTALEVLADHLDEAVVLEVDAYWAAVGGQDPVALLRRLGTRVVALHLKDGPGTPEVLDQVALGSGGQPLREVVEAAPHALRVVELDDCRGDRFAAVADSLTWLRAQGLA